MVCYSSLVTKRNDIGDVHKIIHEGKVSELGCLKLAKNRKKIIVDDGKLDDDRPYYLVALRDGFLPIHSGASFHVVPYSLYWFSQQFGFYQRIPEVLL